MGLHVPPLPGHRWLWSTGVLSSLNRLAGPMDLQQTPGIQALLRRSGSGDQETRRSQGTQNRVVTLCIVLDSCLDFRDCTMRGESRLFTPKFRTSASLAKFITILTGSSVGCDWMYGRRSTRLICLATLHTPRWSLVYRAKRRWLAFALSPFLPPAYTLPPPYSAWRLMNLKKKRLVYLPPKKTCPRSLKAFECRLWCEK